MMKRLCNLLAAATLLSVLPPELSTAFAQGSLTPPGPPGPTMKTLGQLEPRTPIASLPFTITTPGSYYLTTNLTATGFGHGITIATNNVTLDLSGFVLQGGPQSSSGIYFSGSRSNVVVRNGTLTDWGNYGVDAYSVGYPRNTLIEKLRVANCGFKGIHVEAGSVVRDCQVIGVNGVGIQSAGGEIVDCLARNNSSYGIYAVNCTVRGCRTEYNLYGIYLVQSRALECAVDNNTSTGIVIDSGNNNEVRGCRITGNGNFGGINYTGSGPGTIADCYIANNTGFGIAVYGSGVFITGNTCVSNTAAGISLQNHNNYADGNRVLTLNNITGIGVTSSAYTNNIIIRNSVTGAGSKNYFNPGNNNFGPIGTAASATSPWANLSH